MDLTLYVESIQRQLAAAAEAGGDEARALAERLFAPLEAAIRLTLQDALAAAAEQITTELAPGSVELRLRGREIELVVTPPPVDSAAEEESGAIESRGPAYWAPDAASATHALAEADEGGMARINMRLPEQLKARVERAAAAEGLSVNAWLVRTATTVLERHEQPAPGGTQSYTGWVR